MVYLKKNTDNSIFRPFSLNNESSPNTAVIPSEYLKRYMTGDVVSYDFKCTIPLEPRVQIGFEGGIFKIRDKGRELFTREEVLEGLIHDTVTDADSSIGISQIHYAFTPPLLEEDRWSFSVAYRKTGKRQ